MEEKMKRTSIVFIVVAALVLAACAPAASMVGSSREQSQPPMTEALVDKGVSQNGGIGNAAPAAMDAVTSPAMEAPASPAAGSPAAAEQLIVKNANLSIIVPNSALAMQQVTDLAKQMKGWVVSSYLFKSTGDSGQTYTDANITIRVPVDQLEATLTKIRGLVKDPKVDITSENVTGEDVTAQVVDLESRLRNYEKVVVKLNQLMDEATKTEDALNVFNQLVYYQEQIEILKGQIKYYRETAAMSAITLNLTERPAVVPVTIAGWQPGGVALDAIRALVNFLKGLANVLIWVGLCILPVLFLIWLPLFLIWKSMKRHGWVWKGWRPVKLASSPNQNLRPENVEK
jgi:hypothetical protein